MLQVKKYANYFHLLTNRNTIPYTLTYNYFCDNLTNLIYFNTYFYEKAQKNSANFTANTINTLKKYETNTYFFNQKYIFIICQPITIATTPNNHQNDRICHRCHQFNSAGTGTSLISTLLM